MLLGCIILNVGRNYVIVILNNMARLDDIQGVLVINLRCRHLVISHRYIGERA